MKIVTRGFNNSIADVVRRGYDAAGGSFSSGMTGLGTLGIGAMALGLSALTRRIKRFVRSGIGG